MDQILNNLVGIIVGVFGIPALIALGVAKFVSSVSREALTIKIKASIQSEYSERLENLKAQLKASNDSELERQKHALSLEAGRQNVRYARLHEIRATVITETYAMLSETYDALQNYTSPFEASGGPTKDERLKKLAESHAKFRDYFVIKRIFLPAEIADQLTSIEREIRSTGNWFAITIHVPQGRHDTKQWLEILEKVEGPIRSALTQLENEFRKILGNEP